MIEIESKGSHKNHWTGWLVHGKNYAGL